MKINLLLCVAILGVNIMFAQDKYLAKDGFISFFSHSLVEDIKADNHQVLSVIDKNTGEISVQLLMRSFLFKKSLMQQHFNESYVESHKYPKATFKGHILNIDQLEDYNGETEIKGILTIHGKEKEMLIRAKIEMGPDHIDILGEFMVEVAHFDIKIPAVVRNNIAKIIKVNFDIKHKPYRP